MDLVSSISKQGDFSLHLSHHVASQLTSSNLVFSPLSIHVVLALLSAGSKGETLKQLTSFLRSESPDDLASLSSQLITLILADGSPAGGPAISFVNGVWVDESLSLKPSFQKVASSSFNSAVGSVDFQTKAEEALTNVNSWAEKETGGLIKQLLPPGSVNAATRLILGNALYFKGAWSEKFDAAKTKEYGFHLLDGSSVQVPFMTSFRKQYVSSFIDFKVLRLAYKQGEDARQFSMYIFLPDAKDGLWSLTEKLGLGSEFLDRYLPLQKVKVGVFRIPKFKISHSFEVSSSLKDLGLILPFDGEGDLTEMVDSAVSRKLFVSSIFHRSFIEVNEEGTEAAAATAATISLRSAAAEQVDFVADHPFMFVIIEDKTRVVMFTGHVLNPAASP